MAGVVIIRKRPLKAEAEHWRRFLDWVQAHASTRWVFRGLGSAAHDLRPSVGRLPTYSASLEQQIFRFFDRRSAEFTGGAALSRWDTLALGQHHGLPTRLLDWSSNPLVSAYFAVASPPPGAVAPARIIAASVATSDLLDPDRNADPFAISGIGFLLPRSLSPRIVSQSGLFSAHARPAEPWTAPLADPRHRFDIPGSMRLFFRTQLFHMGLEPQMIFGGLDGLSQRIRWQLENGMGLGAI